MTFSSGLHLVLHAAVPAVVAALAARPQMLRVYLIMMATWVVDLDHLLANPVYDPQRCSIGFHPLHSVWAIALYAVLCLLPRARWVGIGLVLHMILDAIDCL